MTEALGLQHLWLFAVTVLVVNATPGVDLMLTLTRTLQFGPRAGLAAALGITTGCVVHTLAAAFGLAALLTASAEAFTVIKWAGAAYLLWLAAGMLRAALGHSTSVAAPGAGVPTRWGIFRQGLLTNVLNPKVALFFLALLPQFIASGAAHKTLAFVALGTWFVVQGLLFLACFVLLVAPLRRVRPTPALNRALNALGAGLFVALAARLALAER